MDSNSTRGHGLRVMGIRYNLDAKGSFFTQRVMGIWNVLPSKVVEAGTLELFKKYLDGHMNRMGMEGYRKLI